MATHGTSSETDDPRREGADVEAVATGPEGPRGISVDAPGDSPDPLDELERVLLEDSPAPPAAATDAGGPSGNGGSGGPPAAVLRPRNGGGPPQRPRMRKLRIAFVVAGLSGLALVSTIFGIMMAVAQDLPALEQRKEFAKAENSVVYDTNGAKLATLTNNEGRILLDAEDIAPVVKQAIVAIEDERFYTHRGVDYRGIARALYQDIITRSAQQGASTITQQFVKNALEAQQSRTVLQKLREAALAYHLERRWSKEKILTEYLNTIYFGEGAHGIEAAARTFFGSEHEGCGSDGATTCASQLTTPEAALLAGMIQSPTVYSPRANAEAAQNRRNTVLQKMHEQGLISSEELERHSDEPLPSPHDIQTPSEESAAPYFTSWMRQQLVDRYGAGQAFGGGLHIVSTLDLELQQEAEAIVERHTGAIEPTAAVVVLDNETAGVRAMIGGDDFESSAYNLATQGHRQPGSAFKPFTLVAALENGTSPTEVFNSAPREFKFVPEGRKKAEIFEVNNYDDSYMGSVSLTDATTYSDNSVYADLGLRLGTKTIANTARRMGVETPLSTNPAMTLGGLTEGVTPLEMAHAYVTLAERGKRVSGSMASVAGGPVGIEEVLNRPGGNPVRDQTGANGQNRPESRQVVSAASADTAVDMLENVVTSGTGRRAAIPGEEAFGKTGTTDDNGDAWFVGSTDEITVAVWVGHDDSNTPMRTEFGGLPVDGGTIPTLIWREVVLAYMNLQAARGEGDEELEEDSTVPAPAPAPAEPAAPAVEAAPVETPEPTPQRPGAQAQGQPAQPAQQPAPEPAVPEGGLAAE